MTPTINDVVALVKVVYQRHAAGCCLHILTDDGNIERADVNFVVGYALGHGHSDCQAAAQAIAQLSRTQRHKLIGRYREYAQ